MSVNTVTIEGYANYVKFGTFSDETAYCNFSLNHSSYAGKDDDGKAKYNNNYIPVKVTGRLAELAGDFLDGESRKVLVVGYLRQRSYETNDGEKRSVLEIIATDLRRCESIMSFGDGGAAPKEKVSAGSGARSSEEPF